MSVMNSQHYHSAPHSYLEQRCHFLSLLCLSTVCCCPSLKHVSSSAVHLWIRSFSLIARMQRLVKNYVSLSLQSTYCEDTFYFHGWNQTLGTGLPTPCYYSNRKTASHTKHTDDQYPRFPWKFTSSSLFFFFFAGLFSLTHDNFVSTKSHLKISSQELGERQKQKKRRFLFLLVAIFACIITSFCHFLSFSQILLI